MVFYPKYFQYEIEDLGDVDDGLVRSWIGRLLLCAWSANALDSSNTPFRSQGPFTDAAHTGFQSTTLQYKMIHREPLHCLMLCTMQSKGKKKQNVCLFLLWIYQCVSAKAQCCGALIKSKVQNQ